MRAIRCPDCGTDSVLRYQCLSLLERVLSWLQIRPFRCQLCSCRFRAFSLGRSYPRHLIDRREHRRIPVQMELAFSGGRIRGEGRVLNLSAGGCMIETRVPVQVDDIYHLELLVPGNPSAIELSAIVRSVTGSRIGLKFLPSARDDRRLRAVLDGRLEPHSDLQTVGSSM